MLKGYAAVVDRLVEGGVDPNSADEHGNTALLLAASEGHVDVVRVLLDRGAAADQPNSKGLTPIEIARAAGRDDLVALMQVE